jgi:putative ABC transport system permease protein
VEAATYIFLSLLAAGLTTALVLPLFNSVFQSQLTVRYFFTPAVFAPVTAIVVLSGFSVVGIAGWKQWRMKAVSLMQKERAQVRFGKALFTFQFVISITLAICSVAIIRQMHYLETAPLGFNRNIIQVNAASFAYDARGRERSELLPVLKQTVSQLKDVSNVAISNGNPISGNSIMRLELDSGRFYSVYLFSGDEDFLKTMDLQIVTGKMPAKEGAGKLVNEQLVRQFSIAEPVGATIPGTKDVIAGVVKDFTVGSFKEAVPPSIISYREQGRALLIDYTGSDLSGLIPQLQAEWRKLFPDDSFDYQIIQADLMKKYKGDIFIYKIVVSFSILSVLLSCIGLFALSWAVVQSRTKEIGIRKVLGATYADVLNLLTWSFTKRIALAFFIAAPIGYYLMHWWLMEFMKRISLDVSVFALSGLIMVAVSALALSVQTVKAALTNPVDEIRNE